MMSLVEIGICDRKVAELVEMVNDPTASFFGA